MKANIKKIRLGKPAVYGIFLLAGLLVPLFTHNSYRIYSFAIICMYIICASGLDILLGYSGQISMGHIAYYAIGAYVTTACTLFLGLPVFVGIFAGAVAAAVVGGLVAVPCAKLKFQFLALASIAFANFVTSLIRNIPALEPYRGLHPPGLSLFGIDLTGNNFVVAYYVALLFVVIFLVAKSALIRSKIGRAFMACRDNTRSADGMGIPVRRYKALAFAISAFYAGFAGAFTAHLTSYVVSDSYVQGNSFNYLIMIILGGTCSILGPVIGAVVFQFINEALIAAMAWRGLIYGVILLIFLAFVPGGCVAALPRIGAWLKKRLNMKKDEKGGA